MVRAWLDEFGERKHAIHMTCSLRSHLPFIVQHGEREEAKVTTICTSFDDDPLYLGLLLHGKRAQHTPHTQ